MMKSNKTRQQKLFPNDKMIHLRIEYVTLCLKHVLHVKLGRNSVIATEYITIEHLAQHFFVSSTNSIIIFGKSNTNETTK